MMCLKLLELFPDRCCQCSLVYRRKETPGSIKFLGWVDVGLSEVCASAQSATRQRLQHQRGVAAKFILSSDPKSAATHISTHAHGALSRPYTHEHL